MSAGERVPIALPDLGTGRAVLSLWYIYPGDRVFEGDRVAEVLVPGATYDVAAPANGILVERLAMPNDSVATGQVLGMISKEE